MLGLLVKLRFSAFQSTRPMRGATLMVEKEVLEINISIHAPHAGRDQRVSTAEDDFQISIHAPHAGRDAPPLP